MNRVERALASAPAGPPAAERAERLAKFTARRDHDDRQTVEHWRAASPEEHAEAMCALSNYAHRTALQTGIREAPKALPRLSALLKGGETAGTEAGR